MDVCTHLNDEPNLHRFLYASLPTSKALNTTAVQQKWIKIIKVPLM